MFDPQRGGSDDTAKLDLVAGMQVILHARKRENRSLRPGSDKGCQQALPICKKVKQAGQSAKGSI